MEMKSLRTAVIGAGIISDRHFEAIRDTQCDCRAGACVSLS